MATNPLAVSAASSTRVDTWDLRYPGLVMADTGRNIVQEFTGMWRLKPDADMDALARALGPGSWTDPPGASFSLRMTMLGLVRTARWFVARTQDFGGYTLFFVSQFDGTLETYFDDFALIGSENLQAVWGQCVGCPVGSGVDAREVVAYIARGQIKTLAFYDAAPSLSVAELFKSADWFEKTQRFRRAMAHATGYGEGGEVVDLFLNALGEPCEPLPSGTAIDPDAAVQWQYEDVAERVEGGPR